MQLKTSTKKGENMLFFKKFSYNALKVTNYIIYTIIYVYTWLKFGHKSKKKCIVFRKHSVLSNFSFRVTTLLVQWKLLPRKCQCWLHVVLRSGKFRWGRG